MIEEFDPERLRRRQTFLESRARAHLDAETDRRWHLSARATLLRDAAAVALILSDFQSARRLLKESGNLFIELGFAGGFQLLFLSGDLDIEGSLIGEFAAAYAHRKERYSVQSDESGHGSRFNDQSFRPAHLLRAYQALAGRRAADEEWIGLRNSLRETLNLNATMPVGVTRMPLATYIVTFDRLANRDLQASEALPAEVHQVLNTLAERRGELLMAARRDRVHWKALLRPAELIDLDLLALFLAGTRRGQASEAIAHAFSGRDATTALPQQLADALKN